MEPKNKEVRRKTFINFLLLFIVCIAIVLTMVFFSVRVPFTENNTLRAKMEEIDKEREFSKNFTVQMVEVSRMLDSINRSSPQEQVTLEGRIEGAIRKLDAMVPDDSVIYNKGLYVNVIHNLGDQQQYLKELRTKSDKDLNENEYKTQLENARLKITELGAKYLECLSKGLNK